MAATVACLVLTIACAASCVLRGPSVSSYRTIVDDDAMVRVDHGFKIGVGVGDRMGTIGAFEEYGRIKVYYETWGEDGTKLTEIPTGPCPDSFGPLDLQCTDSLALSGTQHSQKGQNLKVLFEPCNQGDKCKTQSRSWLQNKYLYLVTQEKRLGSDGIFVRTQLAPLGIGSLSAFNVQVETVDRAQVPLWPKEETLLSLVRQPSYPLSSEALGGVVVGVNEDVIVTRVSSWADMAASIGGFVALISVLFYCLVRMATSGAMDWSLIYHLYKWIPDQIVD